MRIWTAVSVGILCMCGTRVVNADEPRVIPLDSVYSSVWQKGLKRALRDGTPSGRDLDETYRLCQSGASNIVLVRADDFSQAAKMTRLIFAEGRSLNLDPVSEKEGNQCSIWVVVYFGIANHSEPPFWVVHSVEIKKQTIRVTFSKGHPVAGGSDAFAHHFIWAPLGKLQAGSYTLELFDKDQDEVSLLRRVKLPKKNKPNKGERP